MTIDGKIWVTTNNGGIFAFAQGTKQSFTVTGMLQPFNGPLMIYTSPDLPFLYVLEPSQQRLVILNKDGVYQKQIISKDLGVTTDLVVTEDGKTAYLLAGSSVYSVGLE
jgi:DNA-binding beta-propeller fold protein YncE